MVQCDCPGAGGLGVPGEHRGVPGEPTLVALELSGRPRPENAQEPFVNFLVASRILFCSFELLGSSRLRHGSCVLIICRLSHFISVHFRLYYVQGTELHPREFRDE